MLFNVVALRSRIQGIPVCFFKSPREIHHGIQNLCKGFRLLLACQKGGSMKKFEAWNSWNVAQSGLFEKSESLVKILYQNDMYGPFRSEPWKWSVSSVSGSLLFELKGPPIDHLSTKIYVPGLCPEKFSISAGKFPRLGLQPVMGFLGRCNLGIGLQMDNFLGKYSIQF